MDYTNISLKQMHELVVKYGYVHTMSELFDNEIPVLAATNTQALQGMQVDELINYAFWSVGGWVRNEVSTNVYITAMSHIDSELKRLGTSIQSELNL